MRRSRAGLMAELVPLPLILLSLGGTVALLIAIHRRPPVDSKPDDDRVVVALAPAPKIVQTPTPTPVPTIEAEPKPEPPPPPPPVDPTPQVVARIAGAEASQRADLARLRREIQAKDSERAAAESQAESAKGKLARAQSLLLQLNAKAEAFEVEAAKASIEVDALERRKVEQKETIAKTGNGTSYAIVPHRGINGTWRRPIVIECFDGQVELKPNGPSYGLGELLDIPGFGNSSFRSAVAREAVRIQRGSSPDGRLIVPYFFFLIRPDGIKSYYAARRQLEPLGIAFGYELADADWEIEYPNLDDPNTWNGPSPNGPDQTASSSSSPSSASGRKGPGQGNGDALAGAGESGTNSSSSPSSPSGRGGRGQGDEDALAGAGGSGANGEAGGNSPFVWPSGPAATGGNGGPPGGVRPIPLGDLGNNDRGPLGGMGGGGKPGASGIPGDPGNPGELGPFGELAGAGHQDDPTGTEPGKGPGRTTPPNGALTNGRPQRSSIAGSTPSQTGSMPPGELPAGLGEALGGKSSYEQAFAKALERRGMPGGVGNARAGGSAGRAGTGGNPSSGAPDGGQSQPGAQADGSRQDGLAAGSSGKPGSRGVGAGSGAGEGIGFNTARVEIFEVVVACESRGVVIHPGDYRVTTKGLGSKEPLLASQLQALLKARQNERTGKEVVPSIVFVVEPGGQATYAKARTQIAIDGVDWPSTVRISGGDVIRGLSREDW